MKKAKKTVKSAKRVKKVKIFSKKRKRTYVYRVTLDAKGKKIKKVLSRIIKHKRKRK